MKRSKSAPKRAKPAKIRDLQVRLKPVQQLTLGPRNARIHSDAQVASLVASIREFGWTNPVLIRPDGIIVAGHARLLAARELGLQEVPVIELHGLTETQCRALALADNQLALGSDWDEDRLRTELAALEAEDFDLERIGFNEKELARLLAAQGAADMLADPDAVPTLPESAVTRPGDLWLLGDHRLLCADGVTKHSLDAVLDDGRADMVFTEFPDLLSYYRLNRHRQTSSTDFDFETYEDFLDSACSHLIAACRGSLYLSIDSAGLFQLYQGFAKAGGSYSATLIWERAEFAGFRVDYQRQHTPILYGWRSGGAHCWSVTSPGIQPVGGKCISPGG
jgi:hypothetical protein